MIVYIVIHGENHEGSMVIGVYSTKEKAIELQDKARKGIRSSSAEYVDILEWELDGREIVEPGKPGDGLKQIQFVRAFLAMSSKRFKDVLSEPSNIFDKK